MTDLRKAAEMALETLCVGANDAVPNDIDERFEQAIQALRQALAKEEQEPVGYAHVEDLKREHHDFYVNRERGVNEVPLYTAPQKREWVGLTDEEREFFKGIGFVGVDIIEAKLKEKNT